MDIFILQKIVSDIKEKSIKTNNVEIYIRNNYKDIDNIELISDCINLILKNIFKYTNIKELIYFFTNNNTVFDLYKKYNINTSKHLASIILEWYKINPFDIINEIDNTQVFFSIFHNIEDTFKICDFIDNEYLINCLKKINNFSKNDMLFENICTITNEYISRDINISKYILKYFYKNTDESLYQFYLYSLNNILKSNKEQTLNYLAFFLKSNIVLLEEFVFSFALFYIREYKTIEYQYLKILIDKNDIKNNDNIIYIITKIIFYVLKYKIFVNNDYLEKKLIGYINEYNISKISILECLKIYEINQFNLELLKISLEKLLVSELLINQYYLINNVIDIIFNRFLHNGYFEEIFNILKIFYINNKNIMKNNRSKYFNSTIYMLLKKYKNDIIKKINENILINQYELDFYIYILLHISYTEAYESIDFTINLNKDDIIKYFLIIFINTFDLNLILQITTNILSSNIINADIFEEFNIIFISYIYMNYEDKVMDYIESNKNNNSYFNILYDRINSLYIQRKNDIKKILDIKDLKPSKERCIKYNIEHNKKISKEMEKVENESTILNNTVHKQYIKYGDRANIVTNFDNKLNMHSMNFIEDIFSIPIPILYINDTCKFINDKYEIYKFVYGENNEINN
uniref:hypothetical protein n=1 Tax=Brachyspira catarrhinii TaxID=2528966 RepID=UPI003F4CA081